MADTTQERRRSSHRHQRRKRRLEDSNKPGILRKIESIISRHLLKVFGVLFILASLWYAANSADKLISILKRSNTVESVIQNPSAQSAQGTVAEIPSPPPATGPMMLWSLVTAAMVSLLLWISFRFRLREIPRILVLVFYAAILLLAKQFGWQIHILFPLILLFSVLLYLNAIRLHSTLAFKANALLAWGVLLIWWGLKLILGGDHLMIFPLFLYTSLFFLAFLIMGVYRGFIGYHKSSKYTEVLISTMNVLACFTIGGITLMKFGAMGYLWVFSLGLSLVLWVMLYMTGKFSLVFNRAPYLFSAIVLISLVLPLLMRINPVVIFFGILSVMLMANSKFSGDQFSIIGSLVSLAIMLLVYLHNWIFQYLPAVFLGDVTQNTALMIKGLIASLTVVPVLLVNTSLLKNLEVTLSKKWFSRRSYLRIFKGLLLLVLYLAFFWIYHCAMSAWLSNPDIKYLSWFSYSCLFFIVAIPVTASRKSSYLMPLVWFSLIITIAYPLLVHLSVLELRNQFLRHEFYSSAGYYFHYAAVFLLIISMVMTGVFVPKVFKESAYLIQAVWIYYILLGLFLLLSEYDHMTIVTGLRKGITINEIILTNKLIPYSMIAMVYALVLLAAGIAKNIRFLRAIAMVLLAVILCKVLYMDIRALQGMSQTLLLFLLGAVILVLSFFYPKIKRMFRGNGNVHHSQRGHRSHRSGSEKTEES